MTHSPANGGVPAVPLATYRVQLNQDFGFADAAALVPYLAALGITHLYTSPYLKARSGSTHGYDIVDHSALNPEIGTNEDYDQLVRALAAHGMGQILDIVPNHMGVGGDDNVWWLDVLENGQASPYAAFFDIDWRPVKEELRGKVLCPFLGDHYGVVLENGQLKLVFHEEQGEFSVYYYEHRFPIDPMTYPVILSAVVPPLKAQFAPEDRRLLEFETLVSAFGHLPAKRDTAPQQREERNRNKEVFKRQLAALCRDCTPLLQAIRATVAVYNGRPDEPRSFVPLHQLLEQQAYRLAYWQVASDEINYRRFFDINALAGLRMEQPEAFRATHALVLDLVAQGKLQGLRIDHPDGLYDPVRYYEDLRARVRTANGGGDDLYIVAEKILASHEHLPEDWPVQGTTGYEFANLVNGLFVNPDAERALTRVYHRFTGLREDFDELLYERKRFIMKIALTSEMAVLANILDQISESDPRTRDFTLNEIRNGLIEIVACFPVYRTYVTATHMSAEDHRYIDWAVRQARKRSPIADMSLFQFIEEILLLRNLHARDPDYRAAAINFTMKFQQYTAPVMAKALEDTSFYIYNRLISLNEVGGDPRRFGVSLAAFHHANVERHKRWPHTLLSTSTHDTKRSEDVRTRIDALSELPADWDLHLRRWSRLNQGKKRRLEATWAPDRNDEYLLYQTLVGVWPLARDDHGDYATLCARVENYMLKAIREAKRHTSWANPKQDYEDAVRGFVRALFETPEKNRFIADFLAFHRRLARPALLSSLSQTLLKLTAPGVPDIYQGAELWDFSLVDPDNRRPVDYAQRREALAQLQALMAQRGEALTGAVAGLLDAVEDGRAKMFTLWRALQLRHAHPLLFQQGAYQALNTVGPHGDFLCCFARTHAEDAAVTVAPRRFATLLQAQDTLPGETAWKETAIEVPPGVYRNVFTGERIEAWARAGAAVVSAADVLRHFPVALLKKT